MVGFDSRYVSRYVSDGIAAVDMDIYGAFQLCAIGILAAPVTAKLSTTYFYDPSRNVIFIWTGLVLAGTCFSRLARHANEQAC
jgi:hypothetical protein